MAMSDCEKCWDTPCVCGWCYRNYAKYRRIEQASVVLGMTVRVLVERLGDSVPDSHPMAETDEKPDA